MVISVHPPWVGETRAETLESTMATRKKHHVNVSDKGQAAKSISTSIFELQQVAGSNCCNMLTRLLHSCNWMSFRMSLSAIRFKQCINQKLVALTQFRRRPTWKSTYRSTRSEQLWTRQASPCLVRQLPSQGTVWAANRRGRRSSSPGPRQPPWSMIRQSTVPSRTSKRRRRGSL